MNRNYKVIIALILLCMVSVAGCKSDEKTMTSQTLTKEEQMFEELKPVAESYQEIYKQAFSEEKTKTLELKQDIVNCLGSEGYIAGDNDNLVNMQNAERLEEFIRTATDKGKDNVTLYLVMENGGLVRYDLNSEEGQILVTRSSLLWNDGNMRQGVYEEFEAERWEYTEKGWLFLEQELPEGYDGPPGQIGIRVKSLDEELRELNQKYVLPMGYGCNNLLITDWDEKDYSALDFYDLFEIMYRMKYGTPYADNGGVEAVEYWVPAEEFEDVLQTYMNISADELRKWTVFDGEKMAYRYRPRTMDDMEMPYGPEPEVVACEEREDGTLKLTVEAVWIREFTDCVVSSELIVRPQQDGTFRYVSNQVIDVDEGLGFSWRKERLTDEAWEALYGN